MAKRNAVNPNVLNLKEYGDKVLGCWTGKNIGGTLGAPFESNQNMQNVRFYTQDLRGSPAPNDDLDLQLVWLQALEDCGARHLNERILAEYWVSHITGPWSEYGVCKANICAGLMPPLSGSCNNDRWKNSNGAWIRSEIWACLFPGNPDLAIKYAYMDSCVDHACEGIYAELFTAALESAAFVVSDIGELIKIGLSKIPPNCRVARSIGIVREHFTQGKDYVTARQAVVEDSSDLGWFQAPANLAFAVIGLLYSKGDFGKGICLATNCGDDTDCTAATVGAILGIIKGRSGIPEKWIAPIGESIQTVSINSFWPIKRPKTLRELTNRVASLAIEAQFSSPESVKVILGDKRTNIENDLLEHLTDVDKAKMLWERSPYELTFDLPYMRLSIVYTDRPEITDGVEKQLSIYARYPMHMNCMVTLDWDLPPDWKMSPARQQQLYTCLNLDTKINVSLMPMNTGRAMTYVPLRVQLRDRLNPITLHVPFMLKSARGHWENSQCSQEFYGKMDREKYLERVKVV